MGLPSYWRDDDKPRFVFRQQFDIPLELPEACHLSDDPDRVAVLNIPARNFTQSLGRRRLGSYLTLIHHNTDRDQVEI